MLIGYHQPVPTNYFTKKTIASMAPLINWTKETTHGSGVSVRGSTISEKSVNEDDWENYIITDPK